MEGPISEKTQNKFKLLSGMEQTSSKALTVPFPEKKTIYDYQFVTEVRTLKQDLQPPTSQNFPWQHAAHNGPGATLSPLFKSQRGIVEGGARL